MLSLLIAVVVAAIVFDFLNGFHDAANAIATSVSTGVLSIRAAVVLAGVCDCLGALSGTAVAKTIATGFATVDVATQGVVLAALIGASAWNLITWWRGIPSSSSHALIGGLAGAVVARAGVHAFNWAKLVEKVLIPLVASPLLGFTAALLLMVLMLWFVRGIRPAAVNRASRRMQFCSALFMAFSHGANDAQKSMGIVTLALASYAAAGGAGLPAAMLPHDAGAVPIWVILTCAVAIGAGTMAGGKRIIKTMGTKIIRITPLQGFIAETSGTATLLTASHFGIPVSTTHCISACIMGVGASKRISAVRWAVAHRILIAWVLTFPLAAAMAWAVMSVMDAAFGRV